MSIRSRMENLLERIGDLPNVVKGEVEKNTLPGRAPWMLTIYTDDGAKQTSWHRSKAAAKRWAQSVHGVKVK